MIALLIAILIGYVIQNGIFTLHLSKSQQDSVNSDKYKFSRYLISELIGFVIHQAIFIQLLRDLSISLDQFKTHCCVWCLAPRDFFTRERDANRERERKIIS